MKLRHLVQATLLVVGCCALAQTAEARDPRPSSTPARGHEKVELFHAIDEGMIEVDMIGIDTTKANLVFKNKTDKPLSIEMPAAFGGVPVLAQDVGGADAGGAGGAAQTTGGAAGGIGGGGFGGGGGFFSVAADRTRRLGVTTICLEHGKRDPNPKIKYEIKPIDTVTSKPQVIELCVMLGRREIPQNTAQAAAWHLANGLSWQQLAQMDRFRSQITGASQRFFSAQELWFAQRVVKETKKRVETLPKDPTPEHVVPQEQVQQVSQEQQPTD